MVAKTEGGAQVNRTEIPRMVSKTTDVDGLKIFYREGSAPGRPKLLLLHGFPASSHQ